MDYFDLPKDTVLGTRLVNIFLKRTRRSVFRLLEDYFLTNSDFYLRMSANQGHQRLMYGIAVKCAELHLNKKYG